MSDIPKNPTASYMLRTYQEQLDAEGINVGVSRQALDEVLTDLDEQKAMVNDLRLHLKLAKAYILEWGGYASGYFQEKHNLKKDVEEINAVANKYPVQSLSDVEARVEQETIIQCAALIATKSGHAAQCILDIPRKYTKGER